MPGSSKSRGKATGSETATNFFAEKCTLLFLNFAEIMHIFIFDLTKRNDIWDFLHVAMAAPYVDCLATDGSTRSILCAGTLKMDKKFGTRVISKDTELIDWLKDL
jgi:hypothetical protein